MPHVKWNDKYLTGIDRFDEDHKHLVGLLNEVYNIFLSGNCASDKVQSVLDSLIEYTIYHFNMEEDWMRDHDFPRLEEHTIDHKRFIERLTDFNANLQNGTEQFTLEVISFLRVWLLNHILRIDSECGVFARTGLLSPPK